ncbi:MAG: lactonase family protein [Lachnospiraceae bacterium]|nr:lactonase family protein [Lachnospiraceae bacterium]
MKRTFFIADWKREGGVYSLDFDFDSGRCGAVKKAAEGHNTSYFERDGDILYVLSEIGGPGKFAGKVESFEITDGGESLKKLDEFKGIPSGCPHLRLSNDKKTLYFASYGTGAVASLSVDKGKFGALTSCIPYAGKSVNRFRQEASHAHMMCTAPSGAYVLCCDLGTDEVRVYKIGEDGGMTAAGALKTPAGYGPRHMAFSLDGRYLYVICELKYRLLVYALDENCGGKLIRDVDITPDLPDDQHSGAAIKFSKDGKLLLTSNRGSKCSTIDVFSMEDPENPALLATLPGLSHPRDFVLLEDLEKPYLIVLNMISETVEFYAFDRENMRFTLLDSSKGIPAPVCIA